MEIVSPDSVERDYEKKFADYQGAGVLEYWIIDPLKRTVTAFQWSRGKFKRIPEKGKAIHSVVLKGFFLRAEWLWMNPLPKKSVALREMGIQG
jgi:Uma2 family endonuclease